MSSNSQRDFSSDTWSISCLGALLHALSRTCTKHLLTQRGRCFCSPTSSQNCMDLKCTLSCRASDLCLVAECISLELAKVTFHVQREQAMICRQDKKYGISNLPISDGSLYAVLFESRQLALIAETQPLSHGCLSFSRNGSLPFAGCPV